MRLLALDLSLTATGWAHSCGESGVLEPKGLRGMARVQWILDRVHQFASEADLVIIEGYSFGSKGRAVFDIAELGGVVRFTLFDGGTRYVDVAPSSLKMFATGKGNANKLEVFAAAIRKLGLAENDHNIADARWLLEMARTHYTQALTTEKQKQALAGVQWPSLSRVPDHDR